MCWKLLAHSLIDVVYDDGGTLKFNLSLSSGFIIEIIIIMMAYGGENGAERYSTLPEIQFIMTQYNELHESLLSSFFLAIFFHAKMFSKRKMKSVRERNEWVRLLLIECCRGNTSQGGVELSQQNPQNTFPRTSIYLICT